MPVASVRAGDVVVCAKRLADADGDRFLALLLTSDLSAPF